MQNSDSLGDYKYVYLFKLLRLLQFNRLIYHVRFLLEKLRNKLFSLNK